MKLSKIISSALVIGLLFDSGVSSFAGILSEDGRYETFEGNNITIDNILEEDKVDVEIEGNTLVNVVYNEYYKNDGGISSGYIVENGFNSEITEGNGSLVIGKNAVLKDNTVYTLICDINTNMSKISYTFNNNENFSQGGLTENVDFSSGYHRVIKTLTTTTNCTDVGIGNHSVENQAGTYLNIKNLMLLEGDWTNKEIPEYFEGIKSVGELEDNKLTLISENENLLDVSKYSDYVLDITTGGLTDISGAYKTSDYIRVVPGEVYTRSTAGSEICYYDINKRFISGERTNHITHIIIPENVYFVRLVFLNGDNRYFIKGENKPYKDYISRKNEIYLKEPLRSLPNGIKDRIIKRNGQWVVERNTREIILDGNENWQKSSTAIGVDTSLFSIRLDDALEYSNLITNRFSRDLNQWSSDTESVKIYDNLSLCIRIEKDKLQEDTSFGFKEWLNANNTRVIYQLKTPIYEPLKVDISLQLFKDTTHISNNSTIPANIKITVDRTINRAIEAIELSKTNPTVANISQARMWTNLLKESTSKDELNNEINSITNVEDLQLEKKKATSNVDVYVKSENMLLMSLSTNSITFENFSGVEDMELSNAINISINSSLPYQLNSYLLSEIENSYKTSRIEKDLLNIKVNKDSNYKTFVDINEKLILEDDCDAGNNKSHSIDLRLKGSQAHKADIYKTVIKFEAEQK